MFCDQQACKEWRMISRVCCGLLSLLAAPSINSLQTAASPGVLHGVLFYSNFPQINACSGPLGMSPGWS